MVEPAKLALPFTRHGVTLRAITEADLNAMLPYFSDPNVCRFIPWEPRDESGVLEFITNRAVTDIPVNQGEHFIVGFEADGLGLCGQLNFTLTDPKELTGEFGYVINPSMAGRGIASRAVKALLDLLFTELGMRRLTAWIDERNTASIALVERLGLRRESREVEVEYFKGEYVTMLRYAILSREWPQG